VKEVKLHDVKLEDYVSLISRSMPSLMRQAAHEYSEVREWLERIYIAYKLQGSGYPFSADRENSDPTTER